MVTIGAKTGQTALGKMPARGIRLETDIAPRALSYYALGYAV